MDRLRAVGVVLCVGMLAACGGGGGGGGSEPSVPYTGLTTQAKVTTANAQDFASLAMGGADLESVGGFAGRQVYGEGEPGLQGPLPTAWLLQDFVLQRLDINRASRIAAAVQELRDEEPGPCGGSMAINIKVDDQTGSFSGSISFRNYCDEGVLNGGTNFSGTINMAMGTPEYMTMSFGSLSFADASTRMTMGGNLSFDFRGYPTTIFGMSANVRDDVGGKTYRFLNYFVSTTETADGATLDTSGLCYHPDYGYVDFRTEELLHIGFADTYPSSGSIRGEGSDGTWVLLSALSSTECQLQADTNGDGTLDWDSGPILWDDL